MNAQVTEGQDDGAGGDAFLRSVGPDGTSRRESEPRQDVSERRNPFEGVTDYFSELARMRGIGTPRRSRGTGATAERTHASAWVPATDILANGDDLVIRVDLAGVDPEDVDLRFTHGALTVSGTRRPGPADDGAMASSCSASSPSSALLRAEPEHPYWWTVTARARSASVPGSATSPRSNRTRWITPSNRLRTGR